MFDIIFMQNEGNVRAITWEERMTCGVSKLTIAVDQVKHFIHLHSLDHAISFAHEVYD